jgi:hypothetical protein
MKGKGSGLIRAPSSICTEGLMKHVSQGSRCSGRVSNRVITELKSQSLPLVSICQVLSISRDFIQSLRLKQCRYLLTHGAQPFLRSCQLCSPSRTPQHFMEPESSIPCSLEPSTGPYPEPYQSNPLHPILSI